MSGEVPIPAQENPVFSTSSQFTPFTHTLPVSVLVVNGNDIEELGF
jgi:hypothetical protein